MRKYFYVFTVQVITKVDGILVEFAMLPGCYHDIDGMKNMLICLKRVLYTMDKPVTLTTISRNKLTTKNRS